MQLTVVARTTESVGGDIAVVQSNLYVDVRQVVVVSSTPSVGEPTIAQVVANEQTGDGKSLSEQSQSLDSADQIIGDLLELVDSEPISVERSFIEQESDDRASLTEKRNAAHWRDLLEGELVEVSPEWKPVEVQTDIKPISNWRLQPLSVLNNASFQPVENSNSAEGATEVVWTTTETAELVRESAELAERQPSKVSQTFGLLWALVRSLSGTVDSSAGQEPVKSESRPSRSQRNR